MTATLTDFPHGIVMADGVYAPQHDSWLLIQALIEAAVSVRVVQRRRRRAAVS